MYVLEVELQRKIWEDVVSAISFFWAFAHAFFSASPPTWQTPKNILRPHSWRLSGLKLFLPFQGVTPSLGLAPN